MTLFTKVVAFQTSGCTRASSFWMMRLNDNLKWQRCTISLAHHSSSISRDSILTTYTWLVRDISVEESLWILEAKWSDDAFFIQIFYHLLETWVDNATLSSKLFYWTVWQSRRWRPQTVGRVYMSNDITWKESHINFLAHALIPFEFVIIQNITDDAYADVWT